MQKFCRELICYAIRKRLDVVFTYENSDRFEEVKEILRNKHGLVPPHDPIGYPIVEYLVYEDNEGIGRYRVTFLQDRSMILFRYWQQRLTREVSDKNPMSEPLRTVFEFANPRCVTDMALDE